MAIGCIQLCVHGDGCIFYFDALDVGQVLGIQQSHQNIGSDLDTSQAGHRAHAVDPGGGDAAAGDGKGIHTEHACTGDGSLAAAIGVGHTHIYLQLRAAEFRTTGTGGQSRHCTGSIVGSNAYAARRYAAACRDIQNRHKLALRIGCIHDNGGGDGSHALIEALGQHIGSTTGEHVRLSGKDQTEGLHTCLGKGPAIGRSHIDYSRDGSAAAGNESGKDRRIALTGIHCLGRRRHDVATGQFTQIHILHVLQAFVHLTAGSEAAGGDVSARHICLLLRPQHSHSSASQHADGTGIHTPDLGIGSGLTVGAQVHCTVDVQQMAERLFAAQNPGDIFGIVVRHCGVETHTHRTCPSCNGQCLGAGGVLIVLPSGMDIQICGVHFHAGYIHLSNVFCLQEHRAYYHAHCRSTTGEGGNIGPAISVERTVDVHIACVYMDAVKPGKHTGRVEHQQHLSSDSHCAAVDIGSVAFRAGAHIVPDADAAPIHRTRSHIGSGIRSCADVGIHSRGCFGQSNCRTHSHSAAGHAQSKCLRIAVYHCIERNVRCIGRAADGYALG